MTRLDQNRAAAQLANKAGVGVADVKNVIIWGNHSSTQFPDAAHATISGKSIFDIYDFISTFQVVHNLIFIILLSIQIKMFQKLKRIMNLILNDLIASFQFHLDRNIRSGEKMSDVTAAPSMNISVHSIRSLSH